jgi:hypothetical protein
MSGAIYMTVAPVSVFKKVKLRTDGASRLGKRSCCRWGVGGSKSMMYDMCCIIITTTNTTIINNNKIIKKNK